MAIILNLETATTVCSVSLAKDGKLLAFKEQNGAYTHAENLTVFIEDVLQQASVNIKHLDAIAVSKGPGSYTGLRIGVSTAKGLCYSLDKPLIAINTLQHLSLQVSQNYKSEDTNLTTLFCPMIDARRMEVYCALFDQENKEVKATSAEIIDEHFIANLLPTIQTNMDVKLLFFGDGAAKCKEVLSADKNTLFIDGIVPSSRNMVALAEQYYNENRLEDVAYFEPFYLKDFLIGKKKEAKGS